MFLSFSLFTLIGRDGALSLLQLPATNRTTQLSFVDVQEPQLVVLLHFMTPFMSIQPVFESPLARPASLQGSMASQLLVDLLRDRPGAHGMLLVSIESDGESCFFCSFTQNSCFA